VIKGKSVYIKELLFGLNISD